MGKFNKIEEINVWKEAVSLTEIIYKTINKNKNLQRDFALSEQLKKSSISIPSNIAEGFERESNKEFIRFLYIAKGSCGELRTQIYLAKELGYITKEKHQHLNNLCKKISRMIMSLIKTLRQKS